jgi:N-methylhydantoinase B/oxoprolinase/acetone carboxylase alpha subunit
VKRDPERVCVDVNEGYVSLKTAKQVYKVALKKSKGSYVVDEAKTRALRGRRR